LAFFDVFGAFGSPEKCYFFEVLGVFGGLKTGQKPDFRGLENRQKPVTGGKPEIVMSFIQSDEITTTCGEAP
jgi:hypothetical protein